MKRPYAIFLLGVALFAVLGAIFSGVSTFDFIAHLDRQVHSITCSFIPGVGQADVSGSSGCFTVMMSPYSSVMRTSVWGGIPIALASLAVFVYLLFKSLDTLFRKGEDARSETLYLLAATLLPVLTSLIYYYISVAKIGTVCKLCIGIYVASLGVFAMALVAFLLARKSEPQMSGALPWGRYIIYFGEGCLFVFALIGLYLAVKPAYTDAMSNCGQLLQPEDKFGILLKPKATHDGGAPAIEVLDPLCPACKGFAEHLAGSEFEKRMNLQYVLFPLDKSCNWMVNDSMHPGACAVSEAVLCAGDKFEDVVKWAFANQTQLRTDAAKDPNAPYVAIKAQFPELAECVGSQPVKVKLNKSLRWVVANQLPVLTPQLFVNNKKLCDEDSDLGMEFALKRLLDGPKSPAPQAPAPAPVR